MYFQNLGAFYSRFNFYVIDNNVKTSKRNNFIFEISSLQDIQSKIFKDRIVAKYMSKN